MNFKGKEILLIGSGYMAREYLLILANMGCKVTIIGRGEQKIASLKAEFPSFVFHVGGLASFLEGNDELPAFAINAVNVNHLKDTTLLLIKAGVKNILIEKPGDLTNDGLEKIKKCAEENKATVKIAYNRRFYTAINVLKQEMELDGGATSAHFEFTEWVHTIDPAIYDADTLGKWIIANSSHVIDAAFSIIGAPKELNAYIGGQNTIEWHPSGSIFSGSGLSVKDVPFTYNSNWQSAGRWAIEILTNKRRFYLKPMEKLQVQKKGAIAIEEFEIDDQLDKDFKPGLYLLTESFLSQNNNGLVSIDEQLKMNSYYNQIGNY